ncbi:MAG: PD40 domain-containing protein [Acidobacteria bacterium]|nr:PD40 domain-containing protein [Acidobacteriota bacterium]
MTLTRLTTTGDVRGCGSISPDGKLVAYCNLAGSLKIRQVATGATVDLGETDGATTFSPDGNFIYVSDVDEQHPQGVLWAIPSFGGEPRRVLTNLVGAAGLSPDGQRVAFVRWDLAAEDSALMIADVRGGNERRVATLRGETRFEAHGVSWSADGSLLAATHGSIAGGYSARPAVVHVDTGRIETPGTRGWPDSGRTVWLPGNSGILFTARENVSTPLQFWIVRYPDGQTRQVTSDGRGFGNMSVSVTADGSTVVTVPWEIITNIWSTNADATAPLEQWTSGSRYDGYGMIQTTNGRLFYGSYTGSDMGIWTIDAPGGRPRQLTQDFASNHGAPHDGRFVVYGALHDGRFRIWRMDPDGANARVITKGEDDARPFVSPDGQWIYYTQSGAKSAVVRAPADGSGSPSVLTERPVNLLGVSRDGRSLLVWNTGSHGDNHEILDAATGAVTATRTLPSGVEAGWGRRSDLVAYILDRDGVSNLWEQPITGGSPRQLTRFTSLHLFHFSYSADGTRLLLSRGYRTGDLWALRNFR